MTPGDKRWPTIEAALRHLVQSKSAASYITREGLERMLDVRLVSKTDSKLMRFIGLFSRRWQSDFWTTFRLPFGKSTIYYPSSIIDPMSYQGILRHELVHVEQQRPWHGPWVTLLLVSIFPLPVFFSGRWFIERHAYLVDIRSARLTVDQVVDALWSSYGWCWPRGLMRKWFLRQLSL